MRLFSERQGVRPVKSVIQDDYIDQDLRNKLWNALCTYYWEKMPSGFEVSDSPPLRILLRKMWHDYFRLPVDTMPRMWRDAYLKIREYYFSCKWNEVYDLLEFTYNEHGLAGFEDACNTILKEELSAYRFIGGKITKITSEEEIAEIEEALKTPLKPITEHIKSALDLLANRKSPNYRNSIKESVSAVEALCKLITKDPKATLGNALDRIERENKVKIHPALKQAFDKIYGYTSSADGIRHGLMDDPRILDFEDAKFMLVSCSGFINYLLEKSRKAGIKLQS